MATRERRLLGSKKRGGVKRPGPSKLVSAKLDNIATTTRRGPALQLAAKWTLTYVFVGAAIFAASWTRFPNFLLGCVDYAERGYLSLIDYTTVTRRTPALRIIYIDDPTFFKSPDVDKWRLRHTRILRALTTVHAGIVAFDLWFKEKTDSDRDFADAIRNAGATRVILGATPLLEDPTGLKLEISPVLKAALGPGQLASLEVADAPEALTVPILRPYVRLASALATTMTVRETNPTFPLEVALAWESLQNGGPLTARIDVPRGEVGLWRNGQRVAAIPSLIRVEGLDQTGDISSPGSNVAYDTLLQASALFRRLRAKDLESISTRYADAERWLDDSSLENFRTFEGKIVLIGSQAGDYTLALSPNDTVYGYQIHASIISGLLQKDGLPREPAIAARFALLCGLALLGGLARARFPGGDWLLPIPLWGLKISCPVTLLALFGAWTCLAVFAYMKMNIVLDAVYGAAAIVAGYYVRNWVLVPRVVGAPAADATHSVAS